MTDCLSQSSDRGTDVINSFVATFHEEYDQWNMLKERAVKICSDGIEQLGVMSILTSRVKTEKSLLRKLEIRSSLRAYHDHGTILDDQLDFVGLRIALYFPHQKQDIIEMLKNQFHYQSMRPFHRDWKPDEPGIYQNLFGQYVADHVWVCLHSKDRYGLGKHAGYQFEIQLRSVLMDAWAGISHELEYKALSGEPTGTELKLLDALKGHVEVGELMLEQLFRIHQKRIETEDEPILNARDLGDILMDSIPEAQLSTASIGDLNALLLMLKGISSDTPRKVRTLLRHYKADKRLRNDLKQFQKDFQPVPPTVVFYLLEKVLRDVSATAQQFQEAIRSTRKNQNIAWYDSRYWQPLIWLSLNLVQSFDQPNGRFMAVQVRKYAQIWFAQHYWYTRSIETGYSGLAFDDKCIIDCLYRTREYSARGVGFVADLCLFGLAPTESKYTAVNEDENAHEYSGFQVVTDAMHHTYVANPQAWTQALHDFSVSLLDSGDDIMLAYKFFHSVDVALWLLSINERELLVELLKEWPLQSCPNGKPKHCLKGICELAEYHHNQGMARLLKQEILGFNFVDIALIECYKQDVRFVQCR